MNEALFDVQYDLAPGVEEARIILTSPGAPLRVDSAPSPNFYMLKLRDQSLPKAFGLGEPDEELIQESPYPDFHNALGFVPGTRLHYGSCGYTKYTGAAFRQIAKFLTEQKVPFYITMIDDDGTPHLLAGSNPQLGVSLLGKDLEDLIKEKELKEGKYLK